MNATGPQVHSSALIARAPKLNRFVCYLTLLPYWRRWFPSHQEPLGTLCVLCVQNHRSCSLVTKVSGSPKNRGCFLHRSMASLTLPRRGLRF